MSSSPSDSILIIGAGIVGSALASFLSKSSTQRRIIVVDRSIGTPIGSTGHAPGFVGQFNESQILTQLAIDTVKEYSAIPGGFETVGGLEIAFDAVGIEKLRSRWQNATKLGLPADQISLQEASQLAPTLVKPSGSGKALHFPTDGTANAGTITSYFQERAKQAGVQFLERDVKKLLTSDGRIIGVQVQQGDTISNLEAGKVVLATGIWAQELCNDLDFPVSVIPVGHPYKYSGTKAPPSDQKPPFVRWPEAHVYARDHGDHYGIGTYNHHPVHYKPVNGTAIGNWITDFEAPLKTATALLPDSTKAEFELGKSFNGIFSMTPDNMPLAGMVQSVPGLYLAVAVWVTHAAAVAKFITQLIEEEEVDPRTKEALEPERFRGQVHSRLEDKSLRGYNEIYKTEEGAGTPLSRH
ncbi:FAD dependent oxidoreductase [Mariannaea sp. PMI_226]|nr:FAD dependent oxidoreductase [Mariannaea sp. PMI_226]